MSPYIANITAVYVGFVTRLDPKMHPMSYTNTYKESHSMLTTDGERSVGKPSCDTKLSISPLRPLLPAVEWVGTYRMSAENDGSIPIGEAFRCLFQAESARARVGKTRRTSASRGTMLLLKPRACLKRKAVTEGRNPRWDEIPFVLTDGLQGLRAKREEHVSVDASCAIEGVMVHSRTAWFTSRIRNTD